MPARKTAKDYHVLARSRGFIWHGPEVNSVVTKTEWECSYGHHWNGRYNDISNGSGCPYCSGTARKNPSDYDNLAIRRGYYWLGPEVNNVASKTEWKCLKGHQWFSTYSSINSGSGCPYCAGKAPKKPNDYHKLAHERHFKWLGPEVRNISIKTRWECSEGHYWESPYNNVRNGSGCPDCYRIRQSKESRHSPKRYVQIGSSREFEWLGPEVENSHTPTNWMCSSGHTWSAAYHSLKGGSGCPHCYGNYPKQLEDYHDLADRFGFQFVGPYPINVLTKTTWKCSNGHYWKSRFNDISNGVGCPICYGNFPKGPDDYASLADERNLIWIGPKPANTSSKTFWECQNEHTWESTYSKVRSGRGCPICSNEIRSEKQRFGPEKYIALSEIRGFKWNGPEVPNSSVDTIWICENGHQWTAPYHRINSGAGCPFCYGNLKKTPADYHAIAKSRGFRWLETEAPNTSINTIWECEEGHIWDAPFSNINQGSGCPECHFKNLSKLKTHPPEKYSELAKQRGFSWLGPYPASSKSATNWKCLNGHIWSTAYGNIQSGTGCPECLDMVNGARVSRAQRKLCDMLNGILNYKIERYFIDVYIVRENIKIAVEYDTWYWHAHNLKHDHKRDAEIIQAGLKVLRIKTNRQMPSFQQLEEAISRLISGESFAEIILQDWGHGTTAFDMQH